MTEKVKNPCGVVLKREKAQNSTTERAENPCGVVLKREKV